MTQKAFVFIGRSGCGKGTQAQLLMKYLTEVNAGKIFHLEAGARFRDFIKENSYTSKLSNTLYQDGALQPEFLSVWVWSDILVKSLQGGEHVVFDGTPRRLDEARVLESVFTFYGYVKPYIFNLHISKEEAIKRMKARGRLDDVEMSDIDRRLGWFETDVKPAIEFYRNNPQYNFFEIDGEQSVEEIHAAIVGSLHDFNKD